MTKQLNLFAFLSGILMLFTTSLFSQNGTVKAADAMRIEYPNGGRFVEVSAGTWMEYTDHTDIFRFRETSRDEWSIYLKDDNRGTSIQLDLWKKEIILNWDNAGRSKLYDITRVQARGPNYVAPTPQSQPTQVANSSLPNDFTGTLKCMANERYLDVFEYKTTNGADVKLWSYTGGDNQKWRFHKTASGSYIITGVQSNKCLDAEGPNVGNNGCRVEIYECHGGTNQQWIFDPTSQPGVYNIYSAGSRKSLDGDGGTLGADGTKVQLWDYHGGANQRWQVSIK